MPRDYDDDDYDDRPAARRGSQNSGKAVTSLILGLLSFLCLAFTGIPAIIVGILGLRDINNSRGRLRGHGLAVGGIITGAIGLILTPVAAVIGLGLLLLPATQKVREAAVRMQDANNLKQIGLAMHIFHDQHGQFPPATVYDAQGRPLYSWRVLLLPYLGEDALYRQFKLDEPWDSPNNRPLLNRMPIVFQAPGDAETPASGLTRYQVFDGPGAIFDSDPKAGLKPFQVGGLNLRQSVNMRGRLPDIIDGSSNTFLVAEATTPVPWTRPQDLPFRPDQPVPGLGGVSPTGFNVLFADGSVRFVGKSVDDKTLRAYIRKDDGSGPPPLP